MTETTDTQKTEETAIDLLPMQDTPEISRFTRKRHKKRWIFLAVVVVGVGGFFGYRMMNPAPTGIPVTFSTLVKDDLVNRISLSGTVESADSAKVYSSLQSLVQAVNVQVGDEVEAGAVLAQFETEDLQLSIAKQQAAMNQNALINEHTIEVNRKLLENAEGNIDNGLDSQLLSAENSLRNAQQELNDTRSEYNDAQDVHTDADDDLTKAEKLFYKAEREQDEAEKAYKLENEKDTASEATKAAQERLDEAEKAYKTARSDLINAEGAVDVLSAERRSYRRARVAYENALANKQSIENAVNQELDSYQDKIKGSELSADQTVSQLELKQMQKDLDESVLTAPISGTVTAVYAVTGEPGKGLMFVVEDTDALRVKTKIKEYDMATVAEGMKTEVKADATGEKVFEGKIEKIYPTAIKEADGSTKTAGGAVEFETDVALGADRDGLRVGMNVRLNVIAAERAGVYAVPFETLATDAEGNDIVFTTTTDAEGKTFAKAVKVTLGLETDFNIEISAPELTDGMQLIAESAGLTDGAEVRALILPGMANGVA